MNISKTDIRDIDYQHICQNIGVILYLMFILYSTIAPLQIIQIITYTWDDMGSLFSENAMLIAALNI